MLIYHDIYRWKGWGGKLQLASGRCRLLVFDLKKEETPGLAHLRPMVVVVSDLPKEKMSDLSIRSCAGHIATCVARDFGIEPGRMLFVEHYPEVVFGGENRHSLPEHYDAVEFQWRGDLALHPSWRTLRPPLLDLVRGLVAAAGTMDPAAKPDAAGPAPDQA